MTRKDLLIQEAARYIAGSQRQAYRYKNTSQNMNEETDSPRFIKTSKEALGYYERVPEGHIEHVVMRDTDMNQHGIRYDGSSDYGDTSYFLDKHTGHSFSVYKTNGPPLGDGKMVVSVRPHVSRSKVGSPPTDALIKHLNAIRY